VAGCAVLVVVIATSFPLGVVPFAVAVVDAGSEISVGEMIANIGLVDLFIATVRTDQAVGA
jgi:hypothetical protein